MTMLEKYMTTMVEFRRQMKMPPGFTYLCVEDYVLRNGQVMGLGKLTKAEAAVVRRARQGLIRSGFELEIKQCFANAQMIVLFDKSEQLTYVEGYASGHILPVHHGWITINGKVVDPTWDLLNTPAEDPVYFGVPFEDRLYFRERIFAREMVGSLIDDWEAGFPLLRK